MKTETPGCELKALVALGENTQPNLQEILDLHKCKFDSVDGLERIFTDIAARKPDVLILDESLLPSLAEWEMYLQQLKFYGFILLLGDVVKYSLYRKLIPAQIHDFVGLPLLEHHFRNQLSSIGHLKEVDDHQKSLERQIQRAQRMEAIGTLAGGIAHDFNNILQSMYLYLGMAMDALPEGDTRDDIAQVNKAALKAKELVDQVLAFSRGGSSDKSQVYIQYIIKEALKFLRSTLPVSVTLTHRINTECLPVYCDPTQVYQIFMNLCTNAFEALPDQKGEIQITLDQISIDQQASASLRVAPGTFLELIISDDGTEIKAADLSNIFHPFFSTKGPGKGSGLGLSVAYGIVEDLGGEIQVMSTEGKGTTFRLILPVVNPENTMMQEYDLAEIDLENQWIFLVEVDEDIRRGTQQFLQSLGCRVAVFAAPSELLSEKSVWEGPPAVIITSYHMPDMNGFELAEKIKQSRPDHLVILATGTDSTEFEDHDSMKFVELVLKKPWKIIELIGGINQVLAKNITKVE